MPVNRKISSVYRMVDQMHNEYFRAHMSEEEKIVAEESLKGYILPGDLYIMLQGRAKHNPLYLQRSLSYKIEAKHQRRIQMTLSLPGSRDAAAVETQKLLPLIISLARLVSSKTTAEDSAVYKISRSCVITGDDGFSHPQAKFLLPRMDELALDAKSGSLAILFTSYAGTYHYGFNFDFDSIEIPLDSIGGLCLWSKITLESLYSSWKEYPNMDLGEKATSVSLAEMQPCFLQPKSESEKSVVSIHVPSNPLTSSSPLQVKITISAQEVGATENPPYRSLFSFNNILASSAVLGLLPIARLRKGQVAFNYKYYYNKLEKTQVTEDFTCPFCSVKCASFKGLEYHMRATHDLFNFEFWVNNNYPAVDVFLKSEKMITEYFKLQNPNARPEPCPSSSKKSRRRKQKNPVRNPKPGPFKIDDANSVKSEKSQIPPGGAGLSRQLAPPESPADFQVMHMWNSFVKEHRVYADGRISWGCEEFSKRHGPLLVRHRDLLWSWTKYIWTLKIFGLLDPRSLANITLSIKQLAN